MKCNHYILAAFLLLATQAFALQSKTGYCEVGGKTITLSGFTGTPLVQGSYPSCLVTVYQHGTIVLASLYSDNASSPTPLSNPFTASSNGAYSFYSTDGHYDVVLSGGGMASPMTISDVLLFDLSSFTGPILSKPLGFVGAALSPRIALNPLGFLSAGNSSINTLVELGMPSSMSGAGSVDSLMYLNLGTFASPLNTSRQRVGIQGTVNSNGVDKAVWMQVGLKGTVDGYDCSVFFQSGQCFTGVLNNEATDGNAYIGEGFPNGVTTSSLFQIKQHPATTSPGVLPAFSGYGMWIEDDAQVVTLTDGLQYTESDTGTGSPGVVIWKKGAGGNLWLRRRSDGLAMYSDDSSGNIWQRLEFNTGEPKFTLTGYGVGATTFEMKPVAGQQARFNMYDGATIKYQHGKGAANDWFLFDATAGVNRVQTLAAGNNVYATGNSGGAHDFKDKDGVGNTVKAGTLEVHTPAAGQGCLNLIDNVTTEYQLCKGVANDFSIYDAANVRNAYQVSAGDNYLGTTVGIVNHVGETVFDIGVNPGGVGLQHVHAGGGCVTAAGAGATCDSTVNFVSNFASTAYTATCTGDQITSGIPANGGIVSKAVGSLVFRTIAVTAVAAQYTFIDCTVVHN